MDLEYNAKLEAIMKRHNTDVWNEDCANDPEYQKLMFGGRDYNEYSDTVEAEADVETLKRQAAKRWDNQATDKNRRQRRAEARINDKPVNNNRKQTKARKGNRLYLKMAAFAMSVTDKIMRAKYGY